MKIVIQDDYQNCIRSLDCFEKIKHHDVTIYNDSVKDIDSLVNRFMDAEAIVLIRERTIINSALLDKLPRLKVISQTGKVAPHIDLEACKARGITVMDGRGSGAATAELTMLLILAGLRNLVQECNRMQQGLWQGTLGRQLKGKTLGIYGYGRIGEQVAHISKAFGANVVIWGRDNSLQKAMKDGFQTAQNKKDFFSTCDVISLQLRLTKDTQGIVSLEDLSLMKPTALLVNTSRAELIAPNALVQALKMGRPGFAAVDVYEDEPVLNHSNPLTQLPNCLCSPHIGFVEKDNYEAYFGIAFDNINYYCNGNPQNLVA
ncbi:MAG: D-2-hydroxyacid dehydrogenase family protein [Polynucleobacter sp.]|nr:MAG: D-2-hydroxyacid dehydrogenase family protein [Polynucleobacter sp.]